MLLLGLIPAASISFNLCANSPIPLPLRISIPRATFSIEAAGIKYEILYLNASNRILLKRYKETRRNHPLSRDGRVEDGIAKEREIMKFLQDQATYVIDTSQLLTRELKEEIDRIFVDGEEGERFQIAVVSFGFKHGIPADVDLVFDVRFLPNPYYDLNLRPLTGNDKPIQDFVMKHEESVEFLDKLMVADSDHSMDLEEN